MVSVKIESEVADVVLMLSYELVAKSFCSGINMLVRVAIKITSKN
jgi:hypothetical protein